MQGFPDTLFFLWYKHFFAQKFATFLYNEAITYCWKCEFDTDVKIENYDHHDGEQLIFYKKLHIKTQSKEKDVPVIFILLQETKNSNLNYAQENVKCHIQHEKSWLGWIIMEQINCK